MRLKSYPKMKDSGVEWIGEIPDHWEVKKIKRDTVVMRGASPRPIDDPIYFDDDGDYAWVRISDVTSSNGILRTTKQTLSTLGSRFSVKLNPGELFLSIAGSVGKQCITEIPCCIHDGFVYFPKLTMVKKFLYYIFDGSECYKGLGKLGTQLNLNADTIGNIQLPYPPKNEQKQIADFLDKETPRINSELEKNQKLVELLNEKKQTIINQAVTKGLDTSIPMKDSGVEWIGEIPVHWYKTKLKYLCVQIVDGVHQTPEYYDEGIPFISVSNFKNGNLDFSNCKYISVVEHRELTKRCKPERGDVILSKVGTLGATDEIDVDFEFSIFVQLALLKLIKTKLFPKFIKFYLKSNFIQELIQLSSNQTTLKYIGIGDIGNFPIIVPKIDEQKQIANFLDKEISRIDSLILNVESQIKKLQEFNQSLISSAVSGKINVSDFI